MKKQLITYLSGILLLCVSCGGETISKEKTIAIIPKPVQLVEDGGTFEIKSNTKVVLVNTEIDYDHTVNALNRVLSPIFKSDLKVENADKPKSNSINFVVDQSMNPEAYTLDIEPSQVTVTSSTAQGAFYAVQSIRQLLPLTVLSLGDSVNVCAVEVPTCKIEDEPHFQYRGMMFDVCRHFFTVDEVKEVIDILALHKINTLHWHLTEDQGWRIEIKKYPKLTEIGSIRKESKLGHYFDKESGFDGKPYGGFYTQEEIKEVVAYASSNFITVIPEIELPGHAIAALTAYPHLGCTGEGYEVRTTWGIDDRIFCAGKETTYEFWEDVLSEVIELFPSEYIHIGGDEAPKSVWKKCAACQAKIRKENLKDEEHLQGYVTQRVEAFMNSMGRKIIGWDEILEGGVSPNATVMSWRGTEGGIKAAQQGNYAIMTPHNYYYLDYYQSKDKENEPLAIGEYLPLEKVYNFDPYGGLTEAEQQYILGAQGNVWTEYMQTLSHVEYMMLPRISAIAERSWNYEHTDYSDYLKRLNRLVKIYDYEGYNYGKHALKN